MAKKEKSASCVPTGMGCCKVEAVISIDERGQMVLPKETRDKANIQAGDKLAVISWEKDGKTCCLTLIKAEELTDMVRNLLGPLMQDVIRK
jgi:AbrB family looped-hinge helix DNA binding protein